MQLNELMITHSVKSSTNPFMSAYPCSDTRFMMFFIMPCSVKLACCASLSMRGFYAATGYIWGKRSGSGHLVGKSK